MLHINEPIEGVKDARKFEDSLSFVNTFCLSRTEMSGRLIGPTSETLISAKEDYSDDDFFGSDDGNDNKFDDTWFHQNDDMYTDDISDDDITGDDSKTDLDDDLHIFKGRRRLESEKTNQRLCKRYGVCPPSSPDLLECKVKHTKTKINVIMVMYQKMMILAWRMIMITRMAQRKDL